MSDTHILVVEDQRAVAGALRMRLRGLGYEVIDIAKDGAEAIEKAGSLEPDLILMDIRLGEGIDGIEAAQEIRTRFSIPVVYVTAYADHELLARARATHPAGFINKPFTTKDLLTTINLALHQDEDDDSAATDVAPREAVLTTDRDGRISFLSSAAEQVTGWTRQSSIGKALGTALARLYPLSAESAEALVHKVIEDGHEQVLHRRTARGDGPGDVLAALADSGGDRFGALLRFDCGNAEISPSNLQHVTDSCRFVLEHLPHGVILLDADLKVTHVNTHAREVIAASEALSLRGSRLGVADSERQDALRAVVRRIGNAARDDDTTHEMIELDSRGEAARIVAVVTPVPEPDLPGESAVVAVMLYDLMHRRTLSASILRQLYGLTRSEVRLVQCLVGGSSLEDGAIELGISVNTARTHLKHIFHKTGAKRQSELIHQVETGPASLGLEVSEQTSLRRSNKAG